MTKARKLGVCTPVLHWSLWITLFHSLTLEYVERVCVKEVFLKFGVERLMLLLRLGRI